MATTDKKMIDLVARLIHELAYELDANYEDKDIAMFSYDDKTFLTFRAGLRALREHEGTVTTRALHVERRIEKAYEERHNEALPSLNEEVLFPVRPDEDQDEPR